MFKKFINIFIYIISIFFITFSAGSDELNMREILEIIQKDLRTLERAVYSESFQKKLEQKPLCQIKKQKMP